MPDTVASQVECREAGQEADLSVLICTVNRAESLRETLERLAENDLDGIRLNVIVVDNGSTDHTPQVVDDLRGRLDLTYVSESRRGKSSALNRGLECDGLAPIIAVLDDDMTPESDWCRGVLDLCARHPEAGVFASHSYVIWPDGVEVPGWAQPGRVQCWAFSVLPFNEERQLHPGEFPSGNHYWFRRSVVGDRRFQDLWVSDAHFALGLIEDGTIGVVGSSPRCGHRVQMKLLDLDVQRERANSFGRFLPRIRLEFPRTVPQAKLALRRPFLWRMRCLALLVRWSIVLGTARFRRGDDRIVTELCSRIGFWNNLAGLRWRRSVDGDAAGER